MREIVERLKENRQVELAKSILESKGYTVTKLQESSKPKWQYIEYTSDGPETHVANSEEEAQELVDELNKQGIKTKGPTPIDRKDESYDEEDDESEWDPYQGQKYRVSGGSGEHFSVTCTSDPREAIEAWFEFGQKYPMDTSIMSKTKADAVELCKAATEELLTSLYSKYKCPYKLEYLVQEAAKKVADGQKYFHEDSYGYGDSVHPFGVG